LMAVMGVVSITPAFPGIKEEFGLNNSQVGLLITLFTLPGIFLSPFLGVIADRLGRKKVLIPSLFMFAIFGFVCSLTHNYDMLLLFRFLQGVGGSAIGSLNITLIGDLYSGKQRAIAMGNNWWCISHVWLVLSVLSLIVCHSGGFLCHFQVEKPGTQEQPAFVCLP